MLVVGILLAERLLMSTSIQRRERRWTASVRLDGHTVTGTFDLKGQAQEWAQRVRRAILDARAAGTAFDAAAHKIVRRKLKPGDPILPPEPTGPTQAEIDAEAAPRPDWTLWRALDHYDRTVTETLEGWRQARAHIAAWQRHPLAQKRLTDVTAEDLATWIGTRTKVRKRPQEDGSVKVMHEPVSASTVRNDIYRISALYEHASKPVTKGGWGLAVTNPVPAVALPALPPGRQRRLDHGHDGQDGEEERMLAPLSAGLDGLEMVAFFTVAIETGMRRSEVLDLRADEVRSTRLGRVIEREKSKNGEARRVVLTDRATAAVDALKTGKAGREKLFTLDGDAAATRWDIAREKAGCPGLRLHDLRHEAMSRMADAGLSVGALAAQGGYKTMQTLLRYVNASERDIREKLGRR
jgi:integrase